MKPSPPRLQMVTGQKSSQYTTPINPKQDNSNGGHLKTSVEGSPTSFDKAALEVTRGMTSGDGDLTGVTSGCAELVGGTFQDQVNYAVGDHQNPGIVTLNDDDDDARGIKLDGGKAMLGLLR